MFFTVRSCSDKETEMSDCSKIKLKSNTIILLTLTFVDTEIKIFKIINIIIFNKNRFKKDKKI